MCVSLSHSSCAVFSGPAVALVALAPRWLRCKFGMIPFWRRCVLSVVLPWPRTGFLWSPLVSYGSLRLFFGRFIAQLCFRHASVVASLWPRCDPTIAPLWPRYGFALILL